MAQRYQTSIRPEVRNGVGPKPDIARHLGISCFPSAGSELFPSNAIVKYASTIRSLRVEVPSMKNGVLLPVKIPERTLHEGEERRYAENRARHGRHGHDRYVRGPKAARHLIGSDGTWQCSCVLLDVSGGFDAQVI